MSLSTYIHSKINHIKCKDHTYIVVRTNPNEWARTVNCKRIHLCTKCGKLHYEKYFQKLAA